MTLFVPWVVFPLIFAVVSLGCGLLLQRAMGWRIPGALIVPSGFALIVVAASFTTMAKATAPATTPVVGALALAGLVLSRRWRPRIDLWMVAAAVLVFAVYAAPIVLSGSATFAGYITLDDTSTWLALADHAFSGGRSLSGLAPSTYSLVLHDDIGAGYPLGALVPLGVGHQLTGADSAWLFQPLLAFLAALLSLSIYSIASGLIRSRPLRALTAVVGSTPALLFGYAYWSGIKEVTVACLIALLAALAVARVRGSSSPRAMIPIAVAAAAVLDALTGAGAVWFAGLVLLAALMVAARGWRPALISLGALAGLGLFFAIPALAITSAWLRSATSGPFVANGALNNLIHPLSRLQLFGIWPVGDFRLRPHSIHATYVLIGVLTLAAAAGLVVALRRRSWGLPLYLVTAVGGSLIVLALEKAGHGSPWLDGKAFATASPAILVAGLIGGGALFEAGRRVEASAVIAAIVVGVAWSNVLQYRNVWLAPRGQLAELARIGNAFAGDGPTLMTEFQPYGVRHFLRRMDPEGASERRYRADPLRTRALLNPGQYADLDDFDLSAVLAYRTIVLRTSPLESRPPSVYQLVGSGRWYDVWERSLTPRTVLEHLSLGTDTQPVAVAACSDVGRLASIAQKSGGELVAFERPPATVVDLAQSSRPVSWPPSFAGTIIPQSAGTAAEKVTVSRGGAYAIWLGGSARDQVTISIDGRRVGATHQLNNQGQLTPFGLVTLAAGTHQLEVHYAGPGLAPGGGGGQFPLGPLVLGSSVPGALVTVSPADASSLCGKRLDWIEAVAG
jgi:hypothetical protein